MCRRAILCSSWTPRSLSTQPQHTPASSIVCTRSARRFVFPECTRRFSTESNGPFRDVKSLLKSLEGNTLPAPKIKQMVEAVVPKGEFVTYPLALKLVEHGLRLEDAVAIMEPNTEILAWLLLTNSRTDVGERVLRALEKRKDLVFSEETLKYIASRISKKRRTRLLGEFIKYLERENRATLEDGELQRVVLGALRQGRHPEYLAFLKRFSTYLPQDKTMSSPSDQHVFGYMKEGIASLMIKVMARLAVSLAISGSPVGEDQGGRAETGKEAGVGGDTMYR